MNSIYLDIGNSYLKLAAEQEEEWIILFKSSLTQLNELSEFINKLAGVTEIIISSVRDDVTQLLISRLPGITVTLLNRNAIPTAMLHYDSPETLGVDRFITCYAAIQISQSDAIVIDAGSACTIDFMTADGVFQGGVIMPGLGILSDAISAKLPELPVTELKLPAEWPGKSTEKSIQWGAYGGFIYAVERFLRKYQQMHPDAGIFLTGGDTDFLYQNLKREFELHVRNFLLFEGMRDFSRLMKSSD